MTWRRWDSFKRAVGLVARVANWCMDFVLWAAVAFAFAGLGAAAFALAYWLVWG